MSDVIIIDYGASPGEEYEVISYGGEACRKADEFDIIEDEVYWDGFQVGGHYVVIDTEKATREQLDELVNLNESDEDFVPVSDEDGDIKKQDFTEISELDS